MTDKVTSLKTPPHSIESEQAVLAAMMIQNESCYTAMGILDEGDFYRKEHRLIWSAIVELIENNSPADVITVSTYLRASNELQEVGGIDYLGELMGSCQSAANISAYAGIVKEQAIRRHLISVGHGIADSGYHHEGRTALELLTLAQQALMRITATSNDDAAVNIHDVMKASALQIDERSRSGAPVAGLSTGFKDIDEKIGRLRSGEMVVIAGRPSSGKSTIAQNIIENVALAGHHVLFFSVEMPKEMVAKRHMASIGKIPLTGLINENLEDIDWDGVHDSMRKLEGRHYQIDDDPDVTSNQLLPRAQRVAMKAGKPIELIVVDYMQKLRDKAPSNNERVGGISNNIKHLARVLNCPVIALCQLSREVDKRSGKRPVLSDLRDSGEIEQDADIVVFTHQSEQPAWKGIGELIIAKNRNGPLGSTFLTQRFALARFDAFTGKLPIDAGGHHGGLD